MSACRMENSCHSTVSSQATVCLPLKEYMDQTATSSPGQGAQGIVGKAGPKVFVVASN
jgi:hypothetical protein